MASRSLFWVLAFLLGRALAFTVEDTYSAFNTLQQWYNSSTGLWIPSARWWNSANCITVLADLAIHDEAHRDEAHSIFRNTFVRAQAYNMQQTNWIRHAALPPFYAGKQQKPLLIDGQRHKPPYLANITSGFLNDFYDDEGWWALAWIAVYDATRNERYLHAAESIFEDLVKAHGTTPCGGLWWDKMNTYVNAIANGLFFDIAAHLATRTGSVYYLSWAEDQWAWFKRSGLINNQHLINDGLANETCQNNGDAVWSYNQGVIVGGLAELSKATNNDSYIANAKAIADATIVHLTDSDGILHDPNCEPDCGTDGDQFKGIFARNLQILQETSPEDRYAVFLQSNAESVLMNSDGNVLGSMWTGSINEPGNAAAQSSALQLLLAALMTR